VEDDRRTARRNGHFGGTLAGVAAATALAGCATLPSLATLDEQTTRMISGVNAGYTASQLSLAELSPDRASELARAWEPTSSALNAIGAYSQALSSLAAQGAKGGEAARAVAGALNELTGVIGAGAIPASLVTAFAEINKRIAVIRARRSLHDAVGDAQPAVETLARILSEHLSDLTRLHELSASTAAGNLRLANQAVVDYVEAERRAEASVLLILRRIFDYKALGRNATPEDLDAIADLDPHATTATLDAREAHWIGVVRAHRSHLALYADEYAAYVRRVDAIDEARRVGALTFRRGQAALGAWVSAHGKLKEALEEKKPVDFSAFFAATRAVDDAHVAGRVVTATK
jgi:hypothetical protein